MGSVEIRHRSIVTFAKLGRYGRFANGAFQIAGTIGIARKNGYAFGFPYWQNIDHAERFGSKEDIDIQKHFLHPLPIYNGPRLPDYHVQWGYVDVKLHQSVSLQGHMQSFKYFSHCFDEVKWYMRMKDEPEVFDGIALHIRLGDYDNAYHPRIGMEYYAPALEHFPKDMSVLVFSDDMEEARKMFTGNRFSFYDKDYIDSFKRMKTCRHFIIGNSSYSLMAAILGEAKDKKVIAPSPWFGPAWGPNHVEMCKDIYNHDWIVINYKKQLEPV